jgi:SAM-dependent methyltransferase
MACYLCGNQRSRLLFSSPDIVHHSNDNLFSWHQCPSCGLIYLKPRPAPDEMAFYYPEDYALFRSAMQQRRWWQPSLWMDRRDINRRCKSAMRLCASGYVLDVGCGTGEFLATMRQHGWETVGLEPNEVAANYARDHLKLDVHTGKLQELDLKLASFDVITLWTVLEHLYDPLSILQTVHHLLKPNGLLVISIPDIGSLDAHLFGHYWVGYDTPRHLYVYSPGVIRELLMRSGFELWDMEHFQADYYTFLGSVEPWLNVTLNHPGLLRLSHRLLNFPGARMLTWPLFWAVNMLGKGCIVAIYARPTH